MGFWPAAFWTTDPLGPLSDRPDGSLGSAKSLKSECLTASVVGDCAMNCTTVDGRNPAPVDMINIPLFIGFYTTQVV